MYLSSIPKDGMERDQSLFEAETAWLNTFFPSSAPMGSLEYFLPHPQAPTVAVMLQTLDAPLHPNSRLFVAAERYVGSYVEAGSARLVGCN